MRASTKVSLATLPLCATAFVAFVVLQHIMDAEEFLPVIMTIVWANMVASCVIICVSTRMKQKENAT